MDVSIQEVQETLGSKMVGDSICIRSETGAKGPETPRLAGFISGRVEGIPDRIPKFLEGGSGRVPGGVP